jgi:hypothetical protein
VLPFVLMLAFLALALAGINLAEPEAVLDKAITVCLSCMGIG